MKYLFKPNDPKAFEDRILGKGGKGEIKMEHKYPEEKPEGNGIYQVLVDNKGYGDNSTTYAMYRDGKFYIKGYDYTNKILQWAEAPNWED